jgi:hypothetical protein
MRVLYVPQVSFSSKIEYKFMNDSITATINVASDTFDFSSMPDGAEITNITTTLSINPIVEVNRINGVLQVKLLNFITTEATEKEKYPDWIEV